jgi:hypothetical protein
VSWFFSLLFSEYINEYFSVKGFIEGVEISPRTKFTPFLSIEVCKVYFFLTKAAEVGLFWGIFLKFSLIITDSLFFLLEVFVVLVLDILGDFRYSQS